MEQEEIDERNHDIVFRFKQGQTQQQIGNVYGLSRERVRQILSKKGYTRGDGGQRVLAERRKQQESREKELACRRRTGLSIRDKKRIGGSAGDPSSPYEAFVRQRNSARFRGIEWKLTFAAWWYLWCLYGRFEDRGINGDDYVMARYGDVGPYSITNCKIITSRENLSEWRYNKYGNP